MKLWSKKLLASSLVMASMQAVAGGATYNIANASVVEGTGGAVNLAFSVTRTQSGAAESISFATSNGSAIAGTDYTAALGSLSFPIGTLTQTANVPITTDSTVEGNETLSVTLSNPIGSSVGIGTGTATGTITNDDSAVISVNAPSIAEGNAGNTPLPFTVSLSNPVQGAVSFTYTAANGNNVNPLLNATLADNDFVAATGSVSFASDSTTALTVNVPIVGDTEVEPNQGLLLNLSALVLPPTISAASITFAASGAGTINNDDGAVISVANRVVTEGNAGSGGLLFTVDLSAQSKTPVTVQYATSDVSANAGSDYAASSGTLTFAPGVISQFLSIPILGETVVEGNEVFNLNFSSPSGATLGSPVATGTINNDDRAVLSLNSPTLIEGNAGNTPMNFTATLSNPVQGGISATLNTSDGNNANALLNATVADNDYIAVTAAALTMTGVTQTVPVQIVGDTDVEPNQSLRLTISGLTLPAGIPAAAVTLGTPGLGTINNDDATGLSISNVTQVEGNTGTSTMAFNVSLSAPNKDPVTVNFATSDGSATAGSDYVARSGTLTFASNVQNQPLAITINGDAIFENDETFNVTLSAPGGATIANASAIGTITDEDVLGLSINDVTLAEGTGANTVMNFTVALAGASSVPVSVNYASSNGTATAPGDYTPVSGTLNFAPGESSKTVAVTVISDGLVENNETFAMTLSNPTPLSPRVTLSRAVATGTIGNDDAFIQVPTLDWRGLMLLILGAVLIGSFVSRRD